jgi:hypothetical protein
MQPGCIPLAATSIDQLRLQIPAITAGHVRLKTTYDLAALYTLPSITLSSVMPEKEPCWLRRAFRPRLDGNRQNSSTQKETAITTLPELLWEQAYDDLKHDEPKLFELYKTILSRDLEGVKGNIIE